MTYLTVPFLSFVFIVLPVWIPLAIVDVTAFLILLFKEEFNPRTFAFWLSVIVILPFVGFLAYLVWGCTLFIKAEGNRKSLSDAPIMESVSDSVPPENEALEKILTGFGADVYTGGNRAHLYWNPSQGIPKLLEDIANAERYVYVELTNLVLGDYGEKLIAFLSDAAKRGADVRLLTSVRGFGRTPGLRNMREEGVKQATLHRKVHSMFSVATKNRNFRSIVVVDGVSAYTGFGAAVRLEGRSVQRLESRFCADWYYSTGEKIDVHPPASAAEDGCGVQIVASGPDSPNLPMLHGYSAIISQAKNRLYMTFPYLVPTDEMYNTIKQAVVSGTDVRILISATGKHWYQPWNSLAALNPLMEAGAHVYFVARSIVKCMVVADGEVCTVGSGVFNSKSMWADYSLNAVVYSKDLATAAENAFLSEMEDATECVPEEYASRTARDRFRIAVARMFMFLN